MINKIYLLFIVIFLSMPLKTFADDDSSYFSNQESLSHYEDTKYNTVDDVFDSLMNRLVLSLFGKDIFVIFITHDIPNNVMQEILQFSSNDEIEYSKPFNSKASVIMLIVLTLLNFIAVVLLIGHFAYISFERLIITSESGEFLGKNIDAMKTNLKFVIIGFLIFPMINYDSEEKIGYVSVAQLATLKVIGLGSYTADKIFEIYINNTPKYYPEVKMPKADGKTFEMLEIIKYMMCVHTDETYSENSIKFDFVKKTENKYEATSGTERCSLQMEITFDTYSDKLINNEFKKSSLINLDINYLDIQFNEFNNEIENIFTKASLIGSKLVNSKFSIENTNLTKKISEDNWYETCGDFYSGINGFDIKDEELALMFLYKGAKCLSFDYINNFTKMIGVDNVYNYLDNKNYLNNYKLELCTHNFIESTDKRTIISDKNNVLNDKDVDSIIEWKSLDINDCLNKYCNDFENSSIYQCSNAIALAKEHFDRNEISKKGWITSGAYIYRLLSNVGINDRGKVLVNSFKTNFRYNNNLLFNSNNDSYDYGEDINDANEKLTFKHPINSKKVDEFYNIMMENNVLTRKIRDYINKSVDTNIDLSNTIEKIFDEKIYRIKVCLQKPLTVYNGYSCENVTTELNNLGESLITIATSIKLGIFATELKNATISSQGVIKNGNNLDLKNIIIDDFRKSSMVFLVLSSFGGVNIDSLLDGLLKEESDLFNKDSGINDMLILTGSASIFASTSIINQQYLIDIINNISWYLFFVGLFLGIIIPLIPFGLWLMAIIGWIIQFFQLLINLPIWLSSVVGVSNDDTSVAIKVGIKMIISMLIRIPLMVVGLIIAWLLTNVFVQQVLSVELIGMALNYGDSNIILKLFDYLLVLLIYLIMMVIIYNMLFSLIEGFHELAMNWMGDKGSDKIFGKQGQETQAVIGKYRQYSQRFRNLKWNLKKI